MWFYFYCVKVENNSDAERKRGFCVIFNHVMNRTQFKVNIKNLQLYKAINQGYFHSVNQSALTYSQWTGCRNFQPTRNCPEWNQCPLSWHIIYLALCYCRICKFPYTQADCPRFVGCAYVYENFNSYICFYVSKLCLLEKGN